MSHDLHKAGSDNNSQCPNPFDLDIEIDVRYNPNEIKPYEAILPCFKSKPEDFWEHTKQSASKVLSMSLAVLRTENLANHPFKKDQLLINVLPWVRSLESWQRIYYPQQEQIVVDIIHRSCSEGPSFNLEMVEMYKQYIRQQISTRYTKIIWQKGHPTLIETKKAECIQGVEQMLTPQLLFPWVLEKPKDFEESQDPKLDAEFDDRLEPGFKQELETILLANKGIIPCGPAFELSFVATTSVYDDNLGKTTPCVSLFSKEPQRFLKNKKGKHNAKRCAIQKTGGEIRDAVILSPQLLYKIKKVSYIVNQIASTIKESGDLEKLDKFKEKYPIGEGYNYLMVDITKSGLTFPRKLGLIWEKTLLKVFPEHFQPDDLNWLSEGFSIDGAPEMHRGYGLGMINEIYTITMVILFHLYKKRQGENIKGGIFFNDDSLIATVSDNPSRDLRKWVDLINAFDIPTSDKKTFYSKRGFQFCEDYTHETWDVTYKWAQLTKTLWGSIIRPCRMQSMHSVSQIFYTMGQHSQRDKNWMQQLRQSVGVFASEVCALLKVPISYFQLPCEFGGLGFPNGQFFDRKNMLKLTLHLIVDYYMKWNSYAPYFMAYTEFLSTPAVPEKWRADKLLKKRDHLLWSLMLDEKILIDDSSIFSFQNLLTSFGRGLYMSGTYNVQSYKRHSQDLHQAKAIYYYWNKYKYGPNSRIEFYEWCGTRQWTNQLIPYKFVSTETFPDVIITPEKNNQTSAKALASGLRDQWWNLLKDPSQVFGLRTHNHMSWTQIRNTLLGDIPKNIHFPNCPFNIDCLEHLAWYGNPAKQMQCAIDNYYGIITNVVYFPRKHPTIELFNKLFGYGKECTWWWLLPLPYNKSKYESQRHDFDPTYLVLATILDMYFPNSNIDISELEELMPTLKNIEKELRPPPEHSSDVDISDGYSDKEYEFEEVARIFLMKMLGEIPEAEPEEPSYEEPVTTIDLQAMLAAYSQVADEYNPEDDEPPEWDFGSHHSEEYYPEYLNQDSEEEDREGSIDSSRSNSPGVT